MFEVPGYGDVKVSVESVPQSVVLGTTFTINLKVINCSYVTTTTTISTTTSGITATITGPR